MILLALLIRGGVLLLTPNALEADPDGYRRLAENLVEYGTLGTQDAPTAYRPPLYPLLLTGCVWRGDDGRMAIGILHVVLGVATVAVVWMLGRWWGLGNYGAALAAMLVACDPILLNQSTQVMTETPAAFLVAAGLAALEWMGRCPSVGRAILAGILLGLGSLCRPELLLWTILAGVMLCILHSRWLTAPGGFARNLRMPAAFGFAVLLALSPWAIRNQMQFGRPIVTTTHGGYTLLLGNNPEFYEWLHAGHWGDVWQADRFNADWQRRKPQDELAADRMAYAEARQNIGREPGMFAEACLVRLGRFWSPLPHQVVLDETPLRRVSRYAVALWYVLEFFLVVLALAWRLPGRGERGEGREERGESSVCHSSFIIHHFSPWFYGLLLVACLTAVHAVFWSDMRMRASAMPVIALAAAAMVWYSAPQKRV